MVNSQLTKSLFVTVVAAVSLATVSTTRTYRIFLDNAAATHALLAGIMQDEFREYMENENMAFFYITAHSLLPSLESHSVLTPLASKSQKQVENQRPSAIGQPAVINKYPAGYSSF